MSSHSRTIRGMTVVDRRQFLAVGIGAFVIAGLPVAIARRRSALVVRRSVPIMGTLAEFVVVHRDEAAAHRAIHAAIDELRLVETTMSRFDARSDIGRANRLAGESVVAVGAPTALVVREALRWADGTDGSYDPAIGGAVELWDVMNRHAPPADRDRIALAGRRLYRQVEVDGANHPRLRFHDRSVRLDLGSIAKGFGVDRAIDALRAHGISKAVVDVGGDLYALGTAADDEPWQIGIQSPDDDRALASIIPVVDAAVATSGTYRQFFRYRGHRYHHLLDPVTAAPRATPVESFTVRAGSCMEADVAATALYGRDVADANRVLARLAPGARVEAIL